MKIIMAGNVSIRSPRLDSIRSETLRGCRESATNNSGDSSKRINGTADGDTFK